LHLSFWYEEVYFKTETKNHAYIPLPVVTSKNQTTACEEVLGKIH